MGYDVIQEKQSELETFLKDQFSKKKSEPLNGKKPKGRQVLSG